MLLLTWFWFIWYQNSFYMNYFRVQTFNSQTILKLYSYYYYYVVLFTDCFKVIIIGTNNSILSVCSSLFVHCTYVSCHKIIFSLFWQQVAISRTATWARKELKSPNNNNNTLKAHFVRIKLYLEKIQYLYSNEILVCLSHQHFLKMQF